MSYQSQIRDKIGSFSKMHYIGLLRNKIANLRRSNNNDNGGPLNKLFLDQYPQNSRFAESYRILRTHIRFSFTDKEFRSLLVTSAAETEGKTSTVANLSYAMAQAGQNVLMIDADLRKPMLSNLVDSDHSPGLTGLLSDVFGTDVGSGSLSNYGMSDLFWLLSFQKRTGVLHLTEGEEEIDVYFHKGRLVDVDWLTKPEEQRLLPLLKKAKLLTAKQAKDAVAEKENTGQTLRFVLVNMGLVKEEDLTGFVNLTMIECLRAVLRFKSGKFVFKNLAESYFERPSFDPADLARLYRQAVVGEEELHYLARKIGSAVVRSEIENLSILPTGPQPPNPTELLDSDRMPFLLSYLTRRFDRVIVDSPPILPASDALVIAPETDGVLLMVKAGHVNRVAIEKAVEQLRMADANLIGVVLNQVNAKKDAYYKYHHKYYSKYYGRLA
jgi:Mrp family chromosome partitioning ATPase